MRHEPTRPTARTATIVVRCLFVVLVALSLLAGMAGGLARVGALAWLHDRWAGAWLSPSIAHHAFLMICTFMGTVIGIERAVAVKLRIAFAAPLASGLAGLSMLSGSTDTAAALGVVAGLAFVAVNVFVVVRQPAAHTALLLTGALAWFVGNLLFAGQVQAGAAVPWWFSFLVLTIAAERLEMTRLMRRRKGVSQALFALVIAMLLGSGVSVVSPLWGGVIYGASLVGLAVWLLCFDIARRTVMAQGLSRYMAVCLLLGYGWLAVAGLAWVATSMGQAFRDIALHALGLGFVFSMMLAHAPVILPAIARVKLLFGRAFYLPLALLHGSLAVRLVSGHVDPELLAAGAAGNALSILLFAATVGGSALAWRLRRSPAAAARRQRDATAAP